MARGNGAVEEVLVEPHEFKYLEVVKHVRNLPLYVCIRTHARTHARKHVRTYACTHARTHASTCMCSCVGEVR